MEILLAFDVMPDLLLTVYKWPFIACFCFLYQKTLFVFAGTVSKILPPLPAKLTMKIGDDLRFPIGVATTSKGDIVVADTGNHFVKIFTSGGRLRLSVGNKVQ